MLPYQTRSIVSLASLYMIRMLGLFMVLPVLTLTSEDYQGSSIFLLGVALGIYGITQAVLQIPYGILSDRFGRKPLIVIGLVVFALGSMVAASADTITGLIIGRMLQGAGAVAGVIMAMVGDLTIEENRTKAMASIGASIGVAFALSLVLGPLVMSLGGIRWIFWLSLGLSIVGLMIVFWLVPKIPVNNKQTFMVIEDLKAIVTNTDLLRLNLGIFVLHSVLMALFVVLPLLLEAANVPHTQHSWIYLGIMANAFFLMVPLIIIGEKRQKLKTIFLTILPLSALSLACLAAFGQNLTAILSVMLIFFISFNYLEATLPSLMSKTVPAQQRGTGSGVFSTCQFLGAANGGIIGGWLFQEFGLTALMMSCTLFILLWWLIALGMSAPKRAALETKNVIA